MLGGPPPPPPPPPPPVKPKKFVNVTIQLAQTKGGRELGENYIFFEYPDGLGVKRKRANTATVKMEAKTINLCTANEQRSLINATTLAGLGRDFNHYSLSWMGHFQENYEKVRQTLKPWHKLNHLPSSNLLSHKDFLARTMGKLGQQFAGMKLPSMLEPRAEPSSMSSSGSTQVLPVAGSVDDGYANITPQTFVLPFDKAEMIATMEAEPDSLWIEKPYATSRGRGIQVWSARDKDALVQKISRPRKELPPDLQNTQIKLKRPADPAAVVVQRYLSNPYLLDGLKFDLRLYVVVTSFDPLCCYIFNEGLGRFCTTPYSSDPSTVGDAFTHLTNSSVNKYASLSFLFSFLLFQCTLR